MSGQLCPPRARAAKGPGSQGIVWFGGVGAPSDAPPTPDQPRVEWNRIDLNFPMEDTKAFLASQKPPFTRLAPRGKQLQP